MPTDTDTPMFVPPPGLVTQVTDPNTNKTDYAFPLQTEAWLKMQGVVQTALAFPLSQADFASTYGTFKDEGTVETAVAILGAIQKTAAKYGDPQTLISELPAFEQAGTAPESVYGHAVWLAAQTQTTAQQIGTLLQQGLTDIGDEKDPQQRLQDLTDLLTGQGGINSYATTLKGYVDDFGTVVSKYYTELTAELGVQPPPPPPPNSLMWYLNESDNVYKDAQSDLSADEEQIKQLTDNIKHLNDEYIGFTVAASVAPVLLLFPIFGPLLAVADAATFGTLAIQVKNELTGLQTQLDNASDDEKKKTALVTVLKGFNLSAQDVHDDGVAFLNAISALSDGWAKFSGQITTQLKALTAKDLEQWGAFMQKQGFKDAVTGWQLISRKAEDFFDNGFVKFETANQTWLTSESSGGRSER